MQAGVLGWLTGGLSHGPEDRGTVPDGPGQVGTLTPGIGSRWPWETWPRRYPVALGGLRSCLKQRRDLPSQRVPGS